MTRIQRSTETPESKIVVSGGTTLRQVWPDEVRAPAPRRIRTAEIGDPQAVLELLARVDGVEVDDYRYGAGRDLRSVAALTAHCEAAILQAALRIDGELTPAAVLADLHKDLVQRPDRRRELVELLAS